jgi:integrase
LSARGRCCECFHKPRILRPEAHVPAWRACWESGESTVCAHAQREDNARKGFFERFQLDAVLTFLSDDLKPVSEAAYITGWRVRSELLTRQWFQIDFEAGWLRIDPGETKNGEGRNFPLTPELRAVLERQRARTFAVEKATGQIIPWVFHRKGKPIKDFYAAWRRATLKAGVPDRILHDFRRTAVRNLERAGVPRSDAMAMVGHRTESIYRRYAISDEASLKESGAKLSSFHKAEQKAHRKVSPIRNKKKSG